MPYTFRTMKKSEHDDCSWEDLFNCADEQRRNYAVINHNGRVMDTHLTFREANEYVEHLLWDEANLSIAELEN